MIAAVRLNTSARNALIALGVGAWRALRWHVVENTWSGDGAAAFLSGLLRNALTREYPRHKVHRVLEVNDAGGYLSGKAIAAKKEMPKYAKFLNVLD